MKPFRVLLLFLALAGCASFDGAGLVPGQATEADVVAKMGRPAQRLHQPDGSDALYFARLPYGRQTFMATFTPGKVLKRIEPTLDYDHIHRIKVGASTADDVRAILGPPDTAVRSPFKKIEVWEYPWQVGADKRLLWVSISDDGVVRELTDMHDHGADEPTGPGGDMPS